MATFAFKAFDLAGAPTRGEVEADDKQMVAAQLRARGLVVVDIEEQKPTGVGDILKRFRRVKAEQLTVATRQLATMISSGLSILRALFVLEEQTDNDKLREALVAVRKDVEAGLNLSDAMRKQDEVFNELYVAMVAAGESSGKLEETLRRVADQLEKDDSLRRKVKSAMVYPSLILSFAGLVLIALVAFVVPVFQGVFEDFGGDLPAITKLTVGLSNFITGSWYLAIAGLIALVYVFRKWKRSARGKPQWDRVKLKVPMRIGQVVQKVALARWSRTFSSLVSAGVPMLEAIDITGRTSGNDVVEKAMARVLDSVKRGGTIAAPLREAPQVFPAMVCQMVSVGEETGALDAMFAKIADFYDDQVDAALKALTSILEPAMIVIIGAIVGFIVISMYLPLFEVYESIG